MNKKVRGKTLKKILPWSLGAIVLGIIIIACSGFSIFRVLAGPSALESLEEDELEGAYVEINLNALMDTFAETSVTVDSVSTTTNIYCVMTYHDDYFLALKLPASYSDIATEIATEANAVYNGEQDEVGDYGTVRGTVTANDSELQEYYESWFDDVSYFDDDADEEYAASHILGYCVEVGYVGIFSETLIYVLTVIGCIFIAFGVVFLVLGFSGVFNLGLKKYIRNHSDGLTEEEIDRDYNDAAEFKKVRAGQLFVWYEKGFGTKAIRIAETVWLYPRGKTLEEGRMKWTLVFCQLDKSERTIVTKDAAVAQGVIDVIEASDSPAITGFDKEKKQLYDRDFQQFVQIAKKRKNKAKAGK